MTRQQQTGSSHHRGARSVFTALATAAALSLFGGYAGAEHAGLNGAGGPTVDPAIEPYTNHNGLQGKLSIAGSDTMRPLISKLSAQFLSLHPGAQIAVEGTGSSAAIREFLLGLSYQRRGDKVQSRGTAGSNAVELLASSRQLTEEEQKGFEFNYGYRPLEVPIAMDAVAIYVHKNNPIQRLTLAQIDGIFGKGADQEDETGSMLFVLDLADSFITYRSRYRLDPMLPLVLDLLLIDESNPRSLAFQLEAISRHLVSLPQANAGIVLPEERRQILALSTAVRLADVESIAQGDRDGLAALMSRMTEGLPNLSDAIGRRYFSLLEERPHRLQARFEPRR